MKRNNLIRLFRYCLNLLLVLNKIHVLIPNTFVSLLNHPTIFPLHLILNVITFSIKICLINVEISKILSSAKHTLHLGHAQIDQSLKPKHAIEWPFNLKQDISSLKQSHRVIEINKMYSFLFPARSIRRIIRLI